MYAVIDIGSNSMRLVLYNLADGEPRQMLNSKQPAGLAGYIDKEQQLTPRGVQKAVEVLPGDTPETLQRRVMEQAEWLLLPQETEKLAKRLEGSENA